MFEEHKSLYQRKYGKDELKALPKSLMKGQFFQNNEAAFQEALQCGDVELIMGGDKEFYTYRQMKVGKEKGMEHVQRLGSKAKVTQDDYKIMASALDNLNWSFEITKKEERGVQTTGYHKHHVVKTLNTICKRNQERQLTDTGVMPEKMKDILQDAKGAVTKLNSEALKILKKLPHQTDDTLFRRIKKCVSTANLSISDLEHMTTFHEMPDESSITKKGVDKLLYETGTMVETFNEVIEMAKGAFKARRV